MKKIDYQPDALSHHNENIQYWVTQGIVIDGERYSVEELFIRSGNLYGVISKDKRTFYEHQLSSNITQSSYDDKEIKDRIHRLETKEIPTYDDTGIQKRITELENKDSSELSNIKGRLSNIENREDNDNQTLSIEDNTLSISGGNSVTLPNYPKYDDSNVKNRILALESKEDKDTVYDDTNLRNRIVALESKPDNDNQTLTLNDRTISISGGNSITLPEDKGTLQTLSIEGSNLSISDGNTVEIPSKQYNVTSSTDGVTVSSSEDNGVKTYDINMNTALDNYYDKTKTYTKDEVEKLISDQEHKSTDITTYRGQFSNRTFVSEGDFDSNISPRITLTHSSSTGVGIFKIDFKINKGVSKGFMIAKLPDNSPVPVELIESQVWVGNTSTSVWIEKGSNIVKISATTNNDIFNKRIILNITGIFKKL